MNWIRKVIDAIKVGGIRMIDKVNPNLDPFHEFSRLPEVKDPSESLSTKASKFEKDLIDNFAIFDEQIYRYRLTPGREDDMGDQAIWHGIYTAMWAFKYAVSKNEEDGYRVYKCVKGLLLQQPNGKLLRGIKLDGTQIDDASNDSAAGHICGIYYAWKHGNSETKKLCELAIVEFSNDLINNNWSLTNFKGSATKHGKLISTFLTDPLRLALMLTILKVAYAITSNWAYEQHYLDLWNKYNNHHLVEFGKVNLGSFGKHQDTHRAAINYSILADIEIDLIKHGQYVAGMTRLWKLTRKSGNPWIALLVYPWVPLTEIDRASILKHLNEFSFEDKGPAVKKINSTRELELKNKGVNLVNWGDKLVATQPLPRWQVGTQDFFWQRDLYSVDDWIQYDSIFEVYNGGDFLVCYWLGKVRGIL